jgi:hypothetical protein
LTPSHSSGTPFISPAAALARAAAAAAAPAAGCVGRLAQRMQQCVSAGSAHACSSPP